MASKKKKRLGKGGKDTSNDLGLVPSVGQGQGTPGAEDVDPNEPVYCICQRVSYGEMVGCDNEDCKNEWFHLDCMGLLATPTTGSWICPDCCVEKGLIYQGAAMALPAPPATVAPVVVVAPMEEGEQQEEQKEEQLVGGQAGEAAAMVVVEEEGGGAEEEGGGMGEKEGGEEGAPPVVAEEAVAVAAAVEEGAKEGEGEASTAAAVEGEALS